MIKRVYLNESKFRSFFEADGEKDEQNDGVTIKVAPRKNRGNDYTLDDGNEHYSVRRDRRRGTDYTQLNDEEDTENKTVDDKESNTANIDDTENTPDNNDNDDSDYGSDTDDAQDYTDNGDDTEDYSDDGEDDEDDNSDDESEDEEPEDNQQQISSNDKLKKYNLYKKYIILYQKINSFIERLDNLAVDNFEFNMIIKNVSNNLKDLSEMVYEYMTVKYQTSTYVQDMLFYETCITTIQLNFELIRNNKVKLKQ